MRIGNAEIRMMDMLKLIVVFIMAVAGHALAYGAGCVAGGGCNKDCILQDTWCATDGIGQTRAYQYAQKIVRTDVKGVLTGCVNGNSTDKPENNKLVLWEEYTQCSLKCPKDGNPQAGSILGMKSGVSNSTAWPTECKKAS